MKDFLSAAAGWRRVKIDGGWRGMEGRERWEKKEFSNPLFFTSKFDDLCSIFKIQCINQPKMIVTLQVADSHY